jgi:16S rRNA (adenine1518-N6/adenine1519-N6)-dimethyltransferase
MVLTVQKELAENLVARPSSKSYGPLSIVMQLLCDVEIERILNPAVFWPKPGVDSALVVASSRHRDPLEVMRVYPFIQYLFRERRKALGTILKKMPQEMGGPLTSEAVETVFAKMEFDSRRRAESLEPSDFLALLKSVASAFEGR